jgi:hypothetical protein
MDSYDIAKSIMLAVGSHFECTPPHPRTLRNLLTPLFSGMKMKGTDLVLMMVQ